MMLLDALRNQNYGRPPVWMMRQAGRYLPSYRSLREKYSLKTLFLTPELASSITLMPVEQLGVDAAILFSDISVIALSLGLKLDFSEGPIIGPLLGPNAFLLASNLEPLEPVIETIRMTLPRLTVPLIGFCAAPFTMATYLIEGGIEGAKKWAYTFPETFQILLDKICKISIQYLKRQIEAGVHAVQIFDSWANVLSKEHFLQFSLPFYRNMIAELTVPVILFMRGAALRQEELIHLPAAISLDWQTPLASWRTKGANPLQGNLDPDLLYAPPSLIREKTKELLDSMKGDPGFIANLGHGIKADTPIEGARAFVETIQCR